LFVNCAKVLFFPLGINIGSYPQPFPRIFVDIFPVISASNKVHLFFLSQYAITDTNLAVRIFLTSCKIPLLPIVLKTYDENGPGNPFNVSIKSPSSSTIMGLSY